MINSNINTSYFYNSYINNYSQEINSELFNLSEESINKIGVHYLCTQCLKFPYIQFYKDRKFIRLTCSCFNNKKILIKDLFEKHILFIGNNYDNLFSTIKFIFVLDKRFILLLFSIDKIFFSNKSLIKIFLLLKQEQVNLICFLSLQNLIKGNFRHLVHK